MFVSFSVFVLIIDDVLCVVVCGCFSNFLKEMYCSELRVMSVVCICNGKVGLDNGYKGKLDLRSYFLDDKIVRYLFYNVCRIVLVICFLKCVMIFGYV